MIRPPSFWDERYAEPDYAYGTEPNDFVREHAARIPPGSVLCLAEGEGRNAVFLGPRDAALTPTLSDLRTELAGLDLEVAREAHREIREGRFHAGSSATVQVLAFRRA